jgi:hypothetical protein
MAYSLGNVKAWVKAAANEIGPKFGITDIGGWRAHGSVPGSLHPKGLALDLMTSNKAKGTQIADYAIANHDRLGITQVIWYRRIWTPAKGWHPYTGPVPHTDHVHLSFGSTAPKGGGAPVTAPAGNPLNPLDPGNLVGAVSTAAGALKGMAAGVNAVGDLAKKAMWLALPTTQVRIVTGILGVGFLLIGIRFLVKEVHD